MLQMLPSHRDLCTAYQETIPLGLRQAYAGATLFSFEPMLSQTDHPSTSRISKLKKRKDKWATYLETLVNDAEKLLQMLFEDVAATDAALEMVHWQAWDRFMRQYLSLVRAWEAVRYHHHHGTGNGNGNGDGGGSSTRERKKVHHEVHEEDLDRTSFMIEPFRVAVLSVIQRWNVPEMLEKPNVCIAFGLLARILPSEMHVEAAQIVDILMRHLEMATTRKRPDTWKQRNDRMTASDRDNGRTLDSASASNAIDGDDDDDGGRGDNMTTTTTIRHDGRSLSWKTDVAVACIIGLGFALDGPFRLYESRVENIIETLLGMYVCIPKRIESTQAHDDEDVKRVIVLALGLMVRALMSHSSQHDYQPTTTTTQPQTQPQVPNQANVQSQTVSKVWTFLLQELFERTLPPIVHGGMWSYFNLNNDNDETKATTTSFLSSVSSGSDATSTTNFETISRAMSQLILQERSITLAPPSNENKKTMALLSSSSSSSVLTAIFCALSIASEGCMQMQVQQPQRLMALLVLVLLLYQHCGCAQAMVALPAMLLSGLTFEVIGWTEVEFVVAIMSTAVFSEDKAPIAEALVALPYLLCRTQPMGHCVASELPVRLLDRLEAIATNQHQRKQKQKQDANMLTQPSFDAHTRCYATLGLANLLGLGLGVDICPTGWKGAFQYDYHVMI
jgi:hypothetical protein